MFIQFLTLFFYHIFLLLPKIVHAKVPIIAIDLVASMTMTIAWCFRYFGFMDFYSINHWMICHKCIHMHDLRGLPCFAYWIYWYPKARLISSTTCSGKICVTIIDSVDIRWYNGSNKWFHTMESINYHPPNGHRPWNSWFLVETKLPRPKKTCQGLRKFPVITHLKNS